VAALPSRRVEADMILMFDFENALLPFGSWVLPRAL
jgi:hypothetical protein